jgi:hypothetical protein
MQDAPARQVRHQLILDIRRSRFSGPAHSQIPSSGPGHADRADRSRIVFPYRPDAGSPSRPEADGPRIRRVVRLSPAEP